MKNYWLNIASLFDVKIGERFRVICLPDFELRGEYHFENDGLHLDYNHIPWDMSSNQRVLIELLNGNYIIKRCENEQC